MPTVNTAGNLWLDNTVIADIVESQQQQAERRRPRRYLDRVPLVPADDEEITAIWTANRIAADLVAPNQAARVVSAGSMLFNVSELPNIKLGTRLNQQDINRMERLQTRQQAGLAGAEAVFMFWDSIVRERREGVLDRLNALACSMLIGTANYDRLGVQVASNFLMPANLRITTPKLWSDTTALPINDIQLMKQFTEFTYGWVPNRMTITRTDWTNMLNTTQILNLGQRFIGIPATNAVNVADWGLMMKFISAEAGVEIELEDHAYRTEESEGSVNLHRDLPNGTVLFTNSGDDNDRRMFDIGNAPITEAVVARLANMNVDLGGQTRGPAVFATAPTELNPPDITVWGVQRAWPRRKQLCCSSVLIVA